MAVGQVGYKDEKEVKRIDVEKDRDIINKLKKTMTEKTTAAFIAEKEERDKKERAKDKVEKKKKVPARSLACSHACQCPARSTAAHVPFFSSCCRRSRRRRK